MEQKDFDARFDLIWNRLTNESENLTSQEQPIGYVLGGQPGAGKSNLIKNIIEQCNNNIIVISAVNFRKYHPDYEKLQKLNTILSVKTTARFAGCMAEKILLTALQNHYNIVIEGTFRTSETPIKTLQLMKDYGYKTSVQIQTCNKKLSWESCIERYTKMKLLYSPEARITKKESHDVVVKNLSENISKVLKTNLVDILEIYCRSLKNEKTIQSKIFDSTKGIFKKEIVEKVLNNSKLKTQRIKDNIFDLSR